MTKPTPTQQWQTFPMGPKLRAYLGISDESNRGQEAGEQRDPVREQAFGAFVRAYARDVAPLDEGTFVDLIDELVTMDLPEAVLGLADDNVSLLPEDDFRAQMALAVAAMLAGEYERAEAGFRKAQEIIPDEPAPYVNLVQIFASQGRLDEAEMWCAAGLDADPNNFRLWELASSVYQDLYGTGFADALMRLAEKRNSWAGLSLAAELAQSGDQYLKANLLEPLYHQGERDAQFLIEYTAALGVAGEMEKIPHIVWQAEKLSTQGIPWQLYVHAAQAQLSLQRKDEALAQLAKAKLDPKIPDEALAVIDELEKDDETLH